MADVRTFSVIDKLVDLFLLEADLAGLNAFRNAGPEQRAGLITGRFVGASGLEETRVMSARELESRGGAGLAIRNDGKSFLLRVRDDDSVSIRFERQGRDSLLPITALDQILPCNLLVKKVRFTAQKEPEHQKSGPSFSNGLGVYLLTVTLVLGLALPLSMMLIIDKVVTNGAESTLIALTLGVGFLTGFQLVFSHLRAWYVDGFIIRDGAFEQQSVFKRFLMKKKPEKIASATWEALRSVSSMEQFHKDAGVQFYADCCFVVLLALLMLNFSLLLTLVCVVFVPVYIGLSLYGARKIKPLVALLAEFQNKAAAILHETARNHEVINAYALAEYQDKKFTSNLLDEAETRRQHDRFSKSTQQLVEGIQKYSVLVIMLLGVSMVLNGALTLGQYIAFNLLAMQLSQPLLRISNYRRSLAVNQVDKNRLAQVMDAAAVAEPPRSLPPFDCSMLTTIKVNGLRLHHGGVPVKGVIPDVAIRAGDWIGVTGPSGCGKSSLLKCIAGLDDEFEGGLRVNGSEPRSYSRVTYCHHVRYVPQSASLFATSIGENVRLGDLCGNPGSLSTAILTSGLDEISTDFPEGLNTIVGIAGQTISGGQAQRISIARALASNPDVLLLDEATASLDEQAERILLHKLRVCYPRMMVVLVTHRPSTLAFCDDVINMTMHASGASHLRVVES